jgi:glutamyl-tRNA reductase
MLNHVHVLTLTHRHAKLKEIGEIVAAFEKDGQLEGLLTELRESQKVDEICYLATCNRITLLFTTQREVNEAFRFGLLGENAPAAMANLQHLRGIKAIYHLFEIGASIDSLVVGERQILGQFRDAYEQSRNWNLIGDDLRIICDQAARASKDVYNQTRIGEKSVSVVSLSMQELEKQKVPTDARILIIGAGQTNVLVSKFFKKSGHEKLTIVNRSIERAETIAASFSQGKALKLSDLPSYEAGFDVLVVCTGAAEPIVTANLFHWLLAGESPENKVVIDLGVPADVDEVVVAHNDFRYIGIEQLRSLAEENMGFRREEVKRAHGVLHRHLKEIESSYRQRLLERAMSHLPEEIKAVKDTAVNKIFAKELDKLDPEGRDLLLRMMTYMEKRCIGIPMKAAREAILG